MTTIAVKKYDDGKIEMAADSRETTEGGTILQDKAEKICVCTNDCVFGACGDSTQILRFEEWVKSKYKEGLGFYIDIVADFLEKYGMNDFNCDILVVENKTIRRLIDNVLIPLDDNYMAIGSGGCWATGALAAGASPEQAIKIACKYHSHSGGKIQRWSNK